MGGQMATEKVKELEVKIANRVGSGAEALSVLKDARVNLIAVCGYSSGKDAYLLLVPKNARAARNALKKAGYKNIKSVDVLKVDLVNRPGSFKGVLERLANANVNVDYSYAAASKGAGVAIIRAKPFDRALKILK